ncbi:MAG: LemA family protein [Bacteroidota bacterium]
MRSLTTIGIVLGVLFLLFMGGCNNYNNFVDAEENVEEAWANVQDKYERRAALIPNLVATVQGAADNEKDILVGVTEARTGAANFKELIKKANDPSELEGIGQQINSQLGLIFERYPEIRSTNNFLDLQAQLEGTENRISVARQDFNASVTTYNKKVRRFPGSFFASVFGFDEKAQFEAQAGAEQAPKVSFD